MLKIKSLVPLILIGCLLMFVGWLLVILMWATIRDRLSAILPHATISYFPSTINLIILGLVNLQDFPSCCVTKLCRQRDNDFLVFIQFNIPCESAQRLPLMTSNPRSLDTKFKLLVTISGTNISRGGIDIAFFGAFIDFRSMFVSPPSLCFHVDSYCKRSRSISKAYQLCIFAASNVGVEFFNILFVSSIIRVHFVNIFHDKMVVSFFILLP